MSTPVNQNSLYARIANLLLAARQNVVRTVNQTMVNSYFEIGRMIVEDEQLGKERAEYGKKVLKELSDKLTMEFGKGFSVDNLENMRRFFLAYSISEKSSRNSSSPEKAISSPSRKVLKQTESNELSISETISRKFILSWSHYLKLLRIANIDERNFYEIECASNN